MAPVLVEGRLHPASIALQGLKILRGVLIYTLVFVYNVFTAEQGSMSFALSLAALGGMVSMPFVGAVVEWWRFRYRLTAEELQITSGILRRKDRRIPVDRIQDLSSEASVLHRVFGVQILSVQTASTQGAEAELDAVTTQAAEELRAALRKVVDVGAVVRRRRSSEERLLDVRTRDLILRGLTDNRAGLVLAGMAALVDNLLNVGGDRAAEGAISAVRRTSDPLFGTGPAAALWLGGIVIGSVWVIGWLSSAVLNSIRFHAFQLAVENKVFLRRYGLFTLRTHALPQSRIQCVRLEQSLLRRLFGIGVLRTDDMGAGAHEKSAERSGTNVFVPAAPMARLKPLVAHLLPGVDPMRLHWMKTSHTIVRRRSVVGLGVALAVAAGSYWYVKEWALLALLLVVPFAAWGLAIFRSLRYARAEGCLAIRKGVLTLEHAFVPPSKVQAVLLTQTPFDRRHGVAKISITVGGGARVVLPNVPVVDAQALAAELTPR